MFMRLGPFMASAEQPNKRKTRLTSTTPKFLSHTTMLEVSENKIGIHEIFLGFLHFRLVLVGQYAFNNVFFA